MTGTITITPDEARTVLRAAAAAMRAEPTSVDIMRWGTTAEGVPIQSAIHMAAPHCGTPACIAGHIAWQARDRTVRRIVRSDHIVDVANDVVAALLGEGYHDNLFYGSSLGWPRHWADLAVTLGDAETGAQMLEWIAEHGTVAP